MEVQPLSESMAHPLGETGDKRMRIDTRLSGSAEASAGARPRSRSPSLSPGVRQLLDLDHLDADPLAHYVTETFSGTIQAGGTAFHPFTVDRGRAR